MTQGFQEGTTHAGVDLAAPGNAPGGEVRSVGNGRVVYRQDSTDQSGFGHMLRVEHRLADGQFVYSQYAHLAEGSIPVTCGDVLIVGTVVGNVGSTGKSTNPHLHFEMKREDRSRCGYVPSEISACADDVVENYYSPLDFIDARNGKFDFAVSFVSIDGNIFGQGGTNGTIDFLDNFNDGSLTQFPTSGFFSFSPFAEEGGFLRLRTSDGANNFTPGVLVDNAILGQNSSVFRLTNGLGDSEIRAAFRADVPSPGQAYGLQLFTFGTDEVVNIQVGNCGSGPCVNATYTGPPQVTASMPINLQGLQFVVLRLELNDVTNIVTPSFSIDGGTTFTTINLPTPGRVFTSGGEAVVSVFGSVQVSTGFLRFVEGDPGIPGDGITVNGVGFRLAPPFPLAGLTDGFTITVYPPENVDVEKLQVWVTNSVESGPCAVGDTVDDFFFAVTGTGVPNEGVTFFNGVRGFFGSVPQSFLEGFVTELNNAHPGCGIELGDLSVSTIYPQDTPLHLLESIDAAAILLGQNAVPGGGG